MTIARHRKEANRALGGRAKVRCNNRPTGGNRKKQTVGLARELKEALQREAHTAEIQAALAIENELLIREVKKRTDDLAESLRHQTAAAEVLKVISRSTFDLPAVLHALVETAARLCEADKGTITRQKDGTFYRAESYGFSEEFMNYVRGVPVAFDHHSATGRTLLEGSVVHIPDVEKDQDYTFREGQRLGNFRSLLGVPMLWQGMPIGVITLIRSELRAFTDKQIELAATFAAQATIAIQNARLFEEVQVRTRELSNSLDDLRKAKNRLVQTEKLASLGELTAGIAHEIKNPLNFVNNFAALSMELTDELNIVLASTTLTGKIREEVDELTGFLKDNLQKVVLHGRRADSIVKNMLLHSRESGGEHRSTGVNSLVEESLSLAYHGARAEKPQFNIALQRDLDPMAGTIECFPQEITRVLLNLISNGFYAVTKRSENSREFEPVLSARTRDRGEHAEIRIRDNGTGIPPDVREKMFDPFFTTKPVGEGTGLGLSMSHDIIVKQHDGTIDVETSPGDFTEFTILLPRKGNFSAQTEGRM
jgi:signal transduction histidine kinase